MNPEYSVQKDIGYVIELPIIPISNRFTVQKLANEFGKIGVKILSFPCESEMVKNKISLNEMKNFLAKCAIATFPDEVRSVLLFFHGIRYKNDLKISKNESIPFELIAEAISNNLSLNGKLKWIFFACSEVNDPSDTQDIIQNDKISNDTIIIYLSNLGTPDFLKFLIMICDEITSKHIKNPEIKVCLKDFLQNLQLNFADKLKILRSCTINNIVEMPLLNPLNDDNYLNFGLNKYLNDLRFLLGLLKTLHEKNDKLVNVAYLHPNKKDLLKSLLQEAEKELKEMIKDEKVKQFIDNDLKLSSIRNSPLDNTEEPSSSVEGEHC